MAKQHFVPRTEGKKADYNDSKIVGIIEAFGKMGFFSLLFVSIGIVFVYNEIKDSLSPEQPVAEIVEVKEKKEDATRINQSRALMDEIAKGCDSERAVFKKLFGRWVLTVPGAGGVDWEQLFPEDRNKTRRALDELGAGDDVYYSDFLHHIGACE